MGVGLLEIGVEMRRILMFSIKGCYVTVLNHPILVSMLCFIVFLYRTFPFLFSVLLAVSPVVVCTAVLLGTLLSFGQTNIPEIEREEEKTSSHDIVPLKTGVLYDTTTHVECSGDSYYVERYTERDLVEDSINKISDLSPLLEERSRGFQFGNGGFEENEEKHGDGELMESQYSPIPTVDEGFEEARREQNNEEKHGKEELMESQYSPIPTVDEGFEEATRERNNEERHVKEVLMESRYSPIPMVDDGFEEASREFNDQNSEKSEEKHDEGEVIESQYSPIPTVDNDSIEFEFDRSDSFDSRRVNLNSLPGSPWKKETKEEEEQEEEEDDDESFDSESDRAESSSPDASMADIIPMLHELHPLLDEDTPHHVSLLHDGSDAASDSSGKTTESDNELEDGCENQEELEVADDENEDGEDEEGKKDEEDKSKSAITWTEEDQKNLIDLGSSEAERNQRLENLMARRRALKKMRLMMTEKNLIDLESADLPFNIPSISTARNNPFDAANDNYDLGLPPIPGSAPSVLVPRRNPFDLPYDSSEEKPDLMEDEQEFITFQAKDPLFRRHESFIVRPSIFGPNRQEKQDIHLRPYFVPERMASEGTSYSSFQRQFSELSDSKVSSVPETESLSSVEDLLDINSIEGQQRQKSLDQEELECKDLMDMDEHISEEPEMISKLEHTSEHVRHGNPSSKEVEALVQLGTVEDHHEAEEALLQEGRVTNELELDPIEIQSKAETSYQRYGSQSSSSSMAEVSERVFVDKEGEMRSSFEEIMGHVEQDGISRQASFDGPDFHITSTSVDHTSHRQPVYDSSPSASRENIFSAAFSSDQHVESETGFLTRTISFVEREYEENSQDIEKSVRTNEEILAPADDQEFLSREVACEDELDVAKAEISQDDEIFGGANAPPLPELVVGQASIDLKSSADEDIEYEEGTIEHAQQQVSSSRFDADTHIVSQHAVDRTVECLSTSSEHQNVHQMVDEQHSLISEVPLDQAVMPSFEKRFVEDVMEKEESTVSEKHDFPSSNAVESSVTDAQSEVDEKQIPVEYQYASTERSISQCEEELAYSDKSIDEQPPEDREVMEPPAILVESIEEASTTETLNVPEIHDLDDGIPIISSPRTPDSISDIHEVVEAPRSADLSGLNNKILEENDDQIKVLENYVLPPEADDFHHDEQYIVEETDGIEDIDEALLYELDTVGDFSINEMGSSQNEFERRIDSTGEGLSASHGVDSCTPEVFEEACAEVHGRNFPSHHEILNASTFEEIAKHEEECASEIQKSGMSIIDHNDASHTEFAEGEVHNAIDPRPIERGLPEDSDIGPSDPTAQRNLDALEIFMPVAEAHNSVFDVEDSKSTQTGATEVPQEVIVNEETDSGMPVLEAQTIQDIESAFWQVYEKEIEKSNVFELYNAEDSGMPVLEAQTVEDIELAFRGSSKKEIENSNVHELPNAKLVTEEHGSSDNAAVFEVSSSVQNDSGMPEVEAQRIEDIESAFRISSQKEVVHSNVLELPAKLVTEGSGDSEDAAVLDVSSSAQEDSGKPVLEAQTAEDISLAFGQIAENLNVLEQPNAELATEESGSSDNTAVFEVSSSVQNDSGMLEVDAQKIEDIESAFRIGSEKEIVHSNELEIPNAKLATEESGVSDDPAVFDVSSSVQEDSGMSVPEAQTVEDINLAFRKVSEQEIEKSNVLEQLNAELATEESGDDNAEMFDVSSSAQEDSGMPVVEAQTAEEINLAFRQIAEKSNVLEQPNAKLITEESGHSDDASVFEVSSSVQKDSGMPVLEVQTAEGINLAFRQIAEQEIAEKSNVFEQPNAELATEESGVSDDPAVFDVSSSVQEDSGMPVLEAQTAEDITLAFRQISEQEIAEKSNVLEQLNAELATEGFGDSDNAEVFDVSSSAQEDSGMPVVEAQTAEEINLAFTQIAEQEISEKSNVLEQPNAELATEESGNIAAAAEVSSSALEAQIDEDIDMIFRRISEKEMEKSKVLEQPSAQLANEASGSADNRAVLEVSSVTRNMQLPILETRPTEYFDLDHEKLSESDDDDAFTRHDSVGADEHAVESKDKGASSDSQNVEKDLALKQVLEGNLEEPLNSTSEGESAEAKPSGASSSHDVESSVRGSDVPDFGEVETVKGDHEVVVKEVKELTAEKSDHAVDTPITADVEGKKDKSHKKESSSSSSSSSSSNSSSSGSDKE
ncbi:putative BRASSINOSTEROID INSENSITIVE 1-associated receptor kinase 1-like [Capsicum annuum]|nr:putative BRASSINOSTEROID INSENSITIVE 1-associated receptor kinase 1-like [Capsicum annuum]